MKRALANGDPVDDEGEDGARDARSRCVFWREVMDEVKKKGSRVAAGIKDQFLNFEKTQPG